MTRYYPFEVSLCLARIEAQNPAEVAETLSLVAAIPLPTADPGTIGLDVNPARWKVAITHRLAPSFGCKARIRVGKRKGVRLARLEVTGPFLALLGFSRALEWLCAHVRSWSNNHGPGFEDGIVNALFPVPNKSGTISESP